MLASPWLVLRPTVSIEMDGRWQRPRILRGRRLAHPRGQGGKIGEYQMLEAHGLPIPKWTEIVPDIKLEPAEWGPYVVVKPSRGRRGAFVAVHKTGRVRFRPPDDYPDDHLGRKGPMLAQRFIYTGRWPVAFRVLTYFGEPIAAYRNEGRRDRVPLDGADAVKKTGGGLSIVASERGCTVRLVDEADILALARRAHAAFPEIPSLGVDIVREADTGEIHILEVNPGGESWVLTNDSGVEKQAEFGFDHYTQFDALNVIADRSIEIAREYAR